MVPAALVDREVDALAALLAPGDVVIDGGNSHYHDDIRRAAALRAAGMHYVDVGTSGGVWGLERGYCLMIGGERRRCAASIRSSRPWPPGSARSPHAVAPGRPGGTAEQGYLHCGPAGAGHFVKMVHNGIEYGLMAAYAEGFNLLHHAGAGLATRAADAETTPLRQPEHFQYPFDLGEIAEVWRRGSVVASWLLDLTAEAFAASPDAGGLRRAGLGLGRRALDHRRGHRRRRAGPGAQRRPLRPLQLARRRRLRAQGALGAALPVRRPPGVGGRASRMTTSSRRAGRLRRHRRPRLQADLPGARTR